MIVKHEIRIGSNGKDWLNKPVFTGRPVYPFTGYKIAEYPEPTPSLTTSGFEDFSPSQESVLSVGGSSVVPEGRSGSCLLTTGNISLTFASVLPSWRVSFWMRRGTAEADYLVKLIKVKGVEDNDILNLFFTDIWDTPGWLTVVFPSPKVYGKTADAGLLTEEWHKIEMSFQSETRACVVKVDEVVFYTKTIPKGIDMNAKALSVDGGALASPNYKYIDHLHVERKW